jgi:mannan endo-1,4-beta-mannosidase
MTNKTLKPFGVFGLIATLMSCSPKPNPVQSKYLRTTQTNHLFENLKKLVADDKIMFGQANATTISYLGGITKTDINQSDCKDITGSHPAFIESDFMWYSQSDSFKIRDIEAMKQAYERGSVLGYCWHLRGMNSHSFYAREKGISLSDSLLVKNILADKHRDSNPSLNWFLTQMDSLVIPVFKELKFPLIFRPFHEMNGEWFWWGCDNCTPDEYKQLYRLTVDYLRQKGVDNLLYAWSPDKQALFEYYPGDDYVDVLGLDIYEPGIMHYSTHEAMIANLRTMVGYAEKQNKVVAITETGLRNDDEGNRRYPDIYPDFWTKYVLTPIIKDVQARKIAWIMSWYGVDWRKDQSTEAYIPYLGMSSPNAQTAIDDFKAFYNHPATVFNNNIPPMYTSTNQNK